MKKDEVTIKDIILSLRNHLAVILVVTVLLGAATYIYSSIFIPRQYTASVKLYAYSNLDRGSTTYISASEQEANRRLVDTYIVILKSNAILDEVSQRLEEDGLHYSASSIGGMISAASINNTEVFNVSVKSRDPQAAQKIANAVADVAQTRISEILEAGGVSVVDHAKLPVSPSAPNVKGNTLIGLLIGLFLSCLYAIIRDLYDTTVWSEEDLLRNCNIPVLGTIPKLESHEAYRKE